MATLDEGPLVAPLLGPHHPPAMRRRKDDLMSGPNLVRLDPNRPARRLSSKIGVVSMLVFVIGEAMMFAGVIGAFLVTRSAAGGGWAPGRGATGSGRGPRLLNRAA